MRLRALARERTSIPFAVIHPHATLPVVASDRRSRKHIGIAISVHIAGGTRGKAQTVSPVFAGDKDGVGI